MEDSSFQGKLLSQLSSFEGPVVNLALSVFIYLFIYFLFFLMPKRV